MSSLNLKTLQVGTHPTATENYHWTTDQAGSLQLNRGISGTVESNILSVDGSNNITIEGDVAFSGTVTGNTPLTSESTKAATTSYITNKAKSLYYYKQITGAQSVATTGAYGTAIVFDSTGNLYWAVANHRNDTVYTVTSYVYKITPTGEMTTFASQATIGNQRCALAFDASGNLYWAVSNQYNGTTYSQTSYVYKITPAGTKTTFASQATIGAAGTALAFDAAGNLYWAMMNSYNGTTYTQTSYIYKIVPAGTLTTFVSQSHVGATDTALIFDSAGNLFWAVSVRYNGTTGDLTSYVYKITSGGTLTTYASALTNWAQYTDLKFDSSGNLYWAVTNNWQSSNYSMTCYVYKITAENTMTTFASIVSNVGAIGTSIAFDAASNLYWALTNYSNGTIFAYTSYVYKITSDGIMSKLAAFPATAGAAATDLAFDSVGNLYWPVMQAYNGTSYLQTSYLNILYKTPVK